MAEPDHDERECELAEQQPWPTRNGSPRTAANSVLIAVRALRAVVCLYGATSKVKSPSVTCVSTDSTRERHSISPRREPWQRHAKQYAVGGVDSPIAAIDLLAAAIEHAHFAECRLEPLREPQLELRRRSVNTAARRPGPPARETHARPPVAPARPPMRRGPIVAATVSSQFRKMGGRATPETGRRDRSGAARSTHVCLPLALLTGMSASAAS